MEEQVNEINFFAETNFRNQKSQFGIKSNDRAKHTYVIGKTGMGKTTLLENMAIQDIQNGHGVAIADPHGEFAEKMLDYVPANRINDVIYFNPADLDYPIAFNIIEKVDSEHRHLMASGVLGVFKKLWADSWGPRLEYVLRNAILALLEYPGSTLLGIMRMLSDKDFRAKVLDKLKDPVIKSFWVDEYAKYSGKFEVEAIAPIQNKVGQFLSSPLIRNIVGQSKSSFDLRDVMDNQKILIMNLSKGAMGEDSSHLLGNLMITKIQLAVMSRVDIPEEERKPFYLYVDEFQNFATESFANILSEARKYNLNLTLAHQYIEQMTEEVRDAVFGNVGTIISFRVGAADAEYLEKEFTPEFLADDIVNLDFANIYLKLMIDGIASRPFSARTLAPLPKQEESHKEKIIKLSRERYTSSRKEVEDKIAKWSGVIEGEKEDRAEIRLAEKPFEAVCAQCNKKTNVSFKPDGVRPVYCPECLAKVREGKEQGKEPAKPQAPPQPQQPAQNIEVAPRMSLDEASRRRPTSFRATRVRKEVNIEDLRRTIEESLAEKDDKGETSDKQKGEGN